MSNQNLIESIIKDYFDKFRGQEGYFVEDNRALHYFQINPTNTELQDVLLKVREIRDEDLIGQEAEDAMVAHIVSLNIDANLQSKDHQIVMDIASLEFRGQPRFYYAFATRYCCYHHPEIYPIYDLLIEQFLRLHYKRINGTAIEDQQLLEYTAFKILMEEYLNASHLPLSNYWELDKFIWTYGQQIIKELIQNNHLEQEEIDLINTLKIL